MKAPMEASALFQTHKKQGGGDDVAVHIAKDGR